MCCSAQGSEFGVDGAEMVIMEQEKRAIYGAKASQIGYTSPSTYHTELTMTTKATGAVNAMASPAPHSLGFGELFNTTVFTRLPVLERLDDSVHTITIKVDTENDVTETDESNTFSLDFRYPPADSEDLVFTTNLCIFQVLWCSPMFRGFKPGTLVVSRFETPHQ